MVSKYCILSKYVLVFFYCFTGHKNHRKYKYSETLSLILYFLLYKIRRREEKVGRSRMQFSWKSLLGKPFWLVILKELSVFLQGGQCFQFSSDYCCFCLCLQSIVWKSLYPFNTFLVVKQMFSSLYLVEADWSVFVLSV